MENLKKIYIMRGAIIHLGELPFEVISDFKAQGANFPLDDQNGKIRSTRNIYSKVEA